MQTKHYGIEVLVLACVLLGLFGGGCFVEAGPTSRPTAVVIDAAPSVVSYQGSSQAYAHLVIAPMGRALGYIQSPSISAYNSNNSNNNNNSANHLILEPARLHGRLSAISIVRPIYVREAASRSAHK